MPAAAARRPPRIVLLGGAGGVGSSLAFNLLTGDQDYEVVLVDTRPEMVTSHVMDLENAVALGGARSLVRAGGAEDLTDADVVVFCAAVPFRLNTSRSVYLAENVGIVERELRALSATGFGGVLLLLTNPVDVLMTCAYRWGLLPRKRMVGYTLNDSLRLRTAIAAALGGSTHPRDVDAVVLGEHGAGQVPVFSRVKAHGEALRLSEDQREAARTYLDTWYQRHVALDSGRTSTWASGVGAAELVDAICTDSDQVLPASVALEGEYGVHGVCLGVPTLLGRRGLRRVEQWSLADDELGALRQAAVRVGAQAEDAMNARPARTSR
jgi:malate dehydrogenase